MKPFKPPPAPVTRAIIIACIGVQVAATLLGTHFANMLAETAGLIPARLVDGMGSGGVPAPLTLVTALFLHAGSACFFSLTCGVIAYLSFPDMPHGMHMYQPQTYADTLVEWLSGLGLLD